MKTLLGLVLLLLSISVAQASDTIIVRKDGRLDILTAKQAAINKATAKMTSNGQFRGYRLQVLNTRNREEAFKVKADLLQKFPDQKVFALFQSPYFKIRFGNFTDRDEAEKYKKEISRIYPQGVYVIQDAVDAAPTAADQLSEP